MTTTPVLEPHRFEVSDLVGGHPVLNFVNTVTGWDCRPRDWLPDYASLVEWAHLAELVSPEERGALLELASLSPALAKEALGQAKSLRDLLHRVLDAQLDGKPSDDDVAALTRIWQGHASRHRLAIDRLRGVTVQVPDVRLDVVAIRILDAFVALGAELASVRLRRCDGYNCGWFFFDRSKPGRRRWCDMATCGNSAKYHRHRKQHDSQTLA